jgi:hypothetical protein
MADSYGNSGTHTKGRKVHDDIREFEHRFRHALCKFKHRSFLAFTQQCQRDTKNDTEYHNG